MKQLLFILIMLLVAGAYLGNKADNVKSDRQACESQGATFQCDDVKRICTCEGR